MTYKFKQKSEKKLADYDLRMCLHAAPAVRPAELRHGSLCARHCCQFLGHYRFYRQP